MAVIPWLLVAFRALAGPLLLGLQSHHCVPISLAAIIVVAVISDIFDGIIARRLGTDTAFLRTADSVVDLIFWLCVGAVAWLGHRSEILANALPLIILIILESSRMLFDFLKFRAYAAYHTYLSKAWALLLMIATVALVGFNFGGWLLRTAILFGIVCDFEGLFISLILLRSRVDVYTLRHALEFRRLDRETTKP